MADIPHIDVEVAYALAHLQTVIAVSVPAGATVADAIALSGMAACHPEIETVMGAVGIFGRRVPLSAQPEAGDRIEIYRPLVADPKQLRQARARKKRVKQPR